MDQLSQLRVFVRVSEMGSFIKAAHLLGLPRATVSAALRDLESALGTRLLHRTTRRVRPTDDGLTLLARAQALLSEVDDLNELFRSRHGDVAGQLRVDVPSRIARRVIAPALPALLTRYPNFRLFLGSTDRAVDLVREGIDCVVRVGKPAESSLVVKPLGSLELINCASPAYLRAHGTPQHPDELAQGHRAVGFVSSATGHVLPWDYWNDGNHASAAVASRVSVNSAEGYVACCLAGIGLIQVPRFDVQHHIDAGDLVEVMPLHRAADLPISILYPHRLSRSRRLDAFIEWVEDLMAPHVRGRPDRPAAA